MTIDSIEGLRKTANGETIMIAVPYADVNPRRVMRQLRRDLEARDGAAFDLRSFHDELIGHGSLPLATLAKELPGWVKPKA